MKVTKAVIPIAGLASRWLPATKVLPKALLPLLDRPVVQWVVEEAVHAGLTDIVIVSGPGQEQVATHFRPDPELVAHLRRRGKDAAAAVVEAAGDLAALTFVVQDQPLGLGHAIGVARDHVGGEPFAVLLGDDVYELSTKIVSHLLDASARMGGAAVALERVSPERISLYGSAAVEPVDGPLCRITRIVEKPPLSEAPSDLAAVGRYVLPPAIFAAIDAAEPGAGGEIQLTDAIGGLIEAGTPVHGWVFQGGHHDTGTPRAHLAATIALAAAHPDLGSVLRDAIAGLDL